MPYYELVFIAKPDLSPAEIDSLTDKFKKILEDQKGKLISKEYWGLRTLSYKIKKNQRGHYVLMNIESEYPAIAELERVMGFDENLLRRATFKVDEFSEDFSDLMVSVEAKDYKSGKTNLVKKKQQEKDSKIEEIKIIEE